jgi:hypothetical protein
MLLLHRDQYLDLQAQLSVSVAHGVCVPVVIKCRVITTTTSVGYGDVSPKNIAEQCLANLTMLLGMVLNGLLIGALANALTRASAMAHR